jgi:nucleoside 2-deoxyribosyltransferase
MAEQTLSMYLAGSIRDGVLADIEWREHVINALKSLPVRIFNPLGGKTRDESGKWTVSGVPSGARFITKHDKWYVENSDIVLFNFRALSEGYPNIGTLVEFGMAVALDKLIYVIVDPQYTGHNATMYKLHPFIGEFAAQVFDTTTDAVEFLKRHVKVITGRSPSFIPYRVEAEAVKQFDGTTKTLDEIGMRSR